MLAVFLQAFVVQTHVHAFAPLNTAAIERSASVDHASGAHASLGHEQAGCIICQIFASSGRAALPDMATIAVQTNASYETAALEIRRAPRAVTHSWQSRAPPTFL
jgi:hypothetical protein